MSTVASALPSEVTEARPARRARLTDIDAVKAIAIVLVVYGHVVARQGPKDNAWYFVTKNTLYLFHMPLFMFVSGLIMAYTYPRIESIRQYGAYVGRRASRLLPAYLIMATVVVFGKVAASRVMQVDNIPNGPADIVRVLTRPYESATAFLWYVYVLFLYTATLPPLIALVGKRVEILIAVGLALYFLPRTNAFGLGQYTEYFVFFAAGIVGSKWLERLRTAADRGFVAWALLFVVGVGLIGYEVAQGGWGDMAGRLWMLAIGFAAIPFFVGLVRLGGLSSNPVLETLGKYTFTIYLFNTLFIGLFKGVMSKFVSWDGLNFLLFCPTLWLAGVAGPVLLHKAVLSRVPALAKITI